MQTIVIEGLIGVFLIISFAIPINGPARRAVLNASIAVIAMLVTLAGTVLWTWYGLPGLSKPQRQGGTAALAGHAFFVLIAQLNIIYKVHKSSLLEALFAYLCTCFSPQLKVVTLNALEVCEEADAQIDAAAREREARNAAAHAPAGMVGVAIAAGAGIGNVRGIGGGGDEGGGA